MRSVFKRIRLSNDNYRRAVRYLLINKLDNKLGAEFEKFTKCILLINLFFKGIRLLDRISENRSAGTNLNT